MEAEHDLLNPTILDPHLRSPRKACAGNELRSSVEVRLRDLDLKSRWIGNRGLESAWISLEGPRSSPG